MKPTQQLHDLGQSLWLDNITRGLLRDGTLRRYIGEKWKPNCRLRPLTA
jgi:transaldolase